jgi:hypothetical protein
LGKSISEPHFVTILVGLQLSIWTRIFFTQKLLELRSLLRPQKPPQLAASEHMVSFKRVDVSEPELAEDSVVQVKRSTLKKTALAVATASWS